MARRRLLLVTAVAEHAAPLSIFVLAAIGVAVVGGVTFVVLLIPASLGPRVGFLLNFGLFFAVQYGVLVFRTARALPLRPLKEHYVRLQRSMAPALYALADDVSRSLAVPAPAAIWLAPAFESSIRTRPRAYDLVLGLPLLDTLAADELRARIALVLARSFGGEPLTARAYRVALRWAEVFARTAHGAGFERTIAAICLAGFRPSLFEDRERRARDEARLRFGADAVAAAIARPAIYELFAGESFWPDLVARHVMNEQAPDAVSQLRAICRAPLGHDETSRRFARVAKDLELQDTEEAAAQRKQWIPSSDLLPREVEREATALFDASWRRNVAAIWDEASRTAHALEAELASLEARLAVDSLDDADGWRRLELIEQRRGAAEVLPLYREWLDRRPEDARAYFHAGRTALEAGAADALPLLERAMELDARFEADASLLIGTELTSQRKEDEAKSYLDRYETATARIQKALSERAARPDAQRARAHELAPHELRALVDHVGRFPMVAAAFASRLEVEQLPTIPCLVVAVRFRRTWSVMHSEQKTGVLAQIATAPLAMQVLAIESGRRYRGFTKEPAVQIYRGLDEPRSVRLARWGRRAQRVLIAAGLFLVLFTGFQYRDCFPGCWEDISAVLVLGPMILAINALLLTGSPDTTRQRGVAFATSAFFAGMFFFGNLGVFVPVALAGFLRAPLTKRAATWAVALSVPAFIAGWAVTIV